MRFLLLPVLMMLFYACTGPAPEQGLGEASISADSLIARETMVKIMTDVHLIEAYLLNKRNKGIKADSLVSFYYEGIFRKYRITKTQYEGSLRFYMGNPREFAKIYDSVIADLTRREKARSEE
jgi:hypothetical protein